MMAAKIEMTDMDSVKKELFELIQAFGDRGIAEPDLSKTMSSIPVETRTTAINALIGESKLQLCKKGSELIFRAMDSQSTMNHSYLNSLGMSDEEKSVFRAIEGAGSKGIWNREIRNITKLPLNLMSKILKTLETKKLIKGVKSVTASKKKLYMLYGLEPDKSVTGGAWYSGTEFESEYVQILHEQCYQFVKRQLVVPDENTDFVEARKASMVSSRDVKEYIDELKISNVKLTLQDIEMVLETICFDGLVEKITVDRPISTSSIPHVKSEVPCKASCASSDEEDADTGNSINYYRALEKLVESSGLMRVPCGHCPYSHECRPDAVISPEKCLYFERWFSQ